MENIELVKNIWIDQAGGITIQKYIGDDDFTLSRAIIHNKNDIDEKLMVSIINTVVDQSTKNNVEDLGYPIITIFQ